MQAGLSETFGTAPQFRCFERSAAIERLERFERPF
jgi:hypothetical protein